MKILMLSDLYHPIIGGGERHVRALSQRLTEMGHQVSVYTIGSRDLPKYENDGGIQVSRMEGFYQKIPFLFKDSMRKWHPPTSDWLITRQLRSAIEDTRPDIIHAHGRVLYSALPLRKSSGISIVSTLHTYALFCPKTDLMRGENICDRPFTTDCIPCGKESYGLPKSLFAYIGTKMGREKLRSVDKFIAVSPFVREVYARQLGLSDDDIVMIPNFYQPDTDERMERVPEMPSDFILFIGTFIPTKGVNVLIEAYRKLKTETKLVLIGGKHPDYRYESRGNILVFEDAPHGMVMQALHDCRFAVFPSIWPDPCPTVALEAMSQGNAVIASAVGGFKDMVQDGETGLVVPPGDQDALSEAISRLLQEPALASEMGEKGRDRFRQHYALDIVAPQIVEVYQALT